MQDRPEADGWDVQDAVRLEALAQAAIRCPPGYQHCDVLSFGLANCLVEDHHTVLYATMGKYNEPPDAWIVG